MSVTVWAPTVPNVTVGAAAADVAGLALAKDHA